MRAGVQHSLGIRDGLRQLRRQVEAGIDFLKLELHDRSVRKPPWRRRAALLARGFLSNRHELYGLAAGRAEELYLSDLARLRGCTGINAPFKAVLEDKLIFWGVMRGFSPAVAPVAALAHRSLLTWMDGPLAGTSVPLRDGLEALDGRHVLKSPRGSLGRTLFSFERRGRMARVDGVDIPVAMVAEIFADSVLIACPFVQQAPYAQRIFPMAGNSIRLLTMYDEERREPFLAATCHRFGRAGAESIADNWNLGGLTADLDPETGVLGVAVWLDGGARVEGSAHPDTGAAITGVAVPGWTRIRDGILDLARRVPFLPHVGWDVIATEDGYRILEGNGRPGITIVQTFRPLLADPRVRRFLERRGVI